MEDSGEQQPAQVDVLVHDIIEMLMDMEIKRIDHSCLKLFFETILQDLPSLSPEVRAVCLRNFLSLLKKRMQTHSIAAPADEPDRCLLSQSTNTGIGTVSSQLFTVCVANGR